MKKLLIIYTMSVATVLFAQSSPADMVDLDFSTPQYTLGASSQRPAIDDNSACSGNALRAMTTPDYMVSPGDVYFLTFMSSVGPQSLRLFVDQDLKIDISTLGTVRGSGKTFIEVEEEIGRLVSSIYPLSAPKLMILEIGSYPVYAFGEVKTAGRVYACGLTRLSTMLKELKTEFASLRDIQITNRNGQTFTVDLFQARRFGDMSQDPYVRPGDRVFISRVKTSVDLTGSVYRTGKYQLLEGETLEDLILKYGDGFLENGDPTRIRILRAVGGDDLVGERFELTFKDSRNFILQNFDRVSIPILQDFLPVIFFEGAVQIPDNEISIDLSVSQRISYSFYPGETVADAARSIRTQFSQVSNLEQAYVRRGNTFISVDISRYLYDHDFTSDIKLEPNDTIVIPFRQFFVTVSGAVPNPGRYPYVPDRSWKYYVNLAGGIDPIRNSGDKFNVTDQFDKELKNIEKIPPEAKIEVETNSFLFYFNKYAPVITTVLGLVSTTIGILATTDNL